MTASRANRSPLFAPARIAMACALSLTATQALAQNTGGASGAPRSLLPSPVDSGQPLPPVQSAPPPGPAFGTGQGFGGPNFGGQNFGGMPLGEAERLPSLPAPVAVGDLGSVEGPVAGTLTDANGGLGYDMWSGVDREDAVRVLERLSPTLLSPSYRALYLRTLLTEASLPAGGSERPFNALRIQKLLDAGMITDAGALAAAVRSEDPDTQRMQADAMLFAGRDIELCGDATTERLQSADPFWVNLRAYCYHFDGDALALDLTRSVMELQGLADPAFVHLLDALEAEEPTPPDTIAQPNAVHMRMLVRLGLPFPGNVVAGLGTPAAVIAANSAETDPEIRRGSAERAFSVGALLPDVMTDILRFEEFPPAELATAATMARGEPMMMALARIRAALDTDLPRDVQAELVQLGFQIGRTEGQLPQIANLFADDAAGILPARDWTPWAPLMIKGLILADRREAAERWYGILDPFNPAQTPQAREAAIIMALAAPNEMRVADAQEPLGFLAYQSLDPMVPQATLAHTALVIGLFDAVGRPMPVEAQREVDRLVGTEFPGRRPAPALMRRIDEASLDGRTGDLALALLEALGPRGASDMAPDVVVRLVRALQTAGLNDVGSLLASEAILTRTGL